MNTDGEPAQTLDALSRDWSAIIEYLRANGNKANTKQKSKYLAYIDSLQARQENLRGVLQELHSSRDLSL